MRDRNPGRLHWRLAYLNKLSYVYIPVALIRPLSSGWLLIERMGGGMPGWSLSAFCPSYSRFSCRGPHYRLESLSRRAGFSQAGNPRLGTLWKRRSALISGSAVWNTFDGIPANRAYAIAIALLGSIGLGSAASSRRSESPSIFRLPYLASAQRLPPHFRRSGRVEAL